MDAFELARAKHAKNLERRQRNAPQEPEQKVSDTPKIKISNNAAITVRVVLSGRVYEHNFRVPNMAGSIHGFTTEKLQTMLRDALKSQFGKRIEDVNDVH